ncbi:MAG: M20/M25/M40 family metallo-hydrolase [Kiritimatiellae bacterium]|nr:M20/M25/M40 family metallo-hydrolase [Kiritimatiellia bacterium]
MKENSTDKPSSRELSEYFELLKFPTVGADPMHLRDCVQCAMWLKRWLEKIGAEAQLLLPQGESVLNAPPPVVFAERPGDEGSPSILFYGHYDVQPPDPLNEWQSPPFEPTEKDGRVYCRGAQDDKGQFFSFLCGLRDFLETHKGPFPTLKFLLEGQEESGSHAIGKIAADLGERLRANVLLVCDTGAAADLQPAIVAGLRGVSHFTVCLKAANCDLHSGRYGGIVPNAALGMAQLMSSLHNPDGSIAVRGFCDKIEPPTSDELAAAEAAAMSDGDYEKETGVAPVGGETGLSITQRNSFRPTIEVNGIHSGYGGPGSKTVIPCEAMAKLSMRLVPGQNPEECMKLVERHLRQNTPKGMKMEIEDVTGDAPAMRLPLKSPVFRLAASVLEEMDPRGAVFQWDGASIPIVSTLARISGAAPLLVGFGQGEDRIHSPNESFSWRQFALGRTWAQRILAELC